MKIYNVTDSERGKQVGKGANSHLETVTTCEINRGNRETVKTSVKYKDNGTYWVTVETPDGYRSVHVVAESQKEKCQNCNVHSRTCGINWQCLTCGGSGWVA